METEKKGTSISLPKREAIGRLPRGNDVSTKQTAISKGKYFTTSIYSCVHLLIYLRHRINSHFVVYFSKAHNDEGWHEVEM